MEENKKNSKNILISILLIIIILLGGYLVYDKFINKTLPLKCPVCEEKERTTNETAECNCSSDNEKTDDKNKTPVTTNSYKLFSSNLKKKITSWKLNSFFAEDGYWTAYEDDKEYNVTYKVILTNKMELKLVFDAETPAPDNHQGKYISKYGKEIKIANNVISFNIAQYGPGAYQNIYFINENGTIGVAEPYDMFNGTGNKLKITNPLSGYKDIVSIVQGTFDDVGSTQDPYAEVNPK